jgi:hypothetical protein
MVLAMLELDGDTQALLAASAELERRLGTPDGLVARIVAPTTTGIVLLQLWASAEARERNADDDRHRDALVGSGLTALVTGSRARAFENATLQQFALQRPFVSA